MAEVIKHGLLQDPSLLDISLSKKDIIEFIFRAVKVKVDIVEKDPFEKNIRAHLNLGHTFAHAIEKVTEYGLRHGEAVAIGLIAAARLSKRLNLCPANLPEQVEKLVEKIGLPKKVDICAEKMYEAMALDKKWKNGRSRFILLHDIGKPTIVEDIAKEDILAICKSIVE